MKQRKKTRLFAFVLSVLMVVTMFSNTVSAVSTNAEALLAEAPVIEITEENADDALLVSDNVLAGISKTWLNNTKAEKGITERPYISLQYIPDHVTEIKTQAFSDRGSGTDWTIDYDLLSLHLEDSNLIKINTNAFYGQKKLRGAVVMPDTLKELGKGAFQACELLEGVLLNDGLEKIGEISGAGTFASCFNLRYVRLKTDSEDTVISLPNGLKFLGYQVFYKAFAPDIRTSVDVPASLETIDKGAFDTDAITEIYVKRTAGFDGYNANAFKKGSGQANFGNGNRVIICPNSTVYKELTEKSGVETFLAKKGFAYEVTVSFMDGTQELTSQPKLYNQSMRYVKNSNGKWNYDDSYQFPTYAKAGYTISGWEKEDGKKWDMGNDVVTEPMALFAAWLLNAPTVTLSPDKTTVHIGGAITLTATASHEADSITGYEYEWYKNGRRIVGIANDASSISVKESGSYTVKVKATDGELTSEKAESTPVVCTVTPHEVDTKWTADDTDHWHICTVSGCTEKFDVAAHAGGTATCKEKAVCTVCNHPYGELDDENHAGDTEVRDEKAATCTQDGYTGNTYCLDCGNKIAEGEPILSSGHSYTNYVSNNDATCTQDGTETATCDNGCGETDTRTDADSSLGHDMGEWKTITSPDCTNKGSQQRQCSRCDYTETKDVDPNGHDWDDEFTIDKEATCTTDGSKSIHCKNCDVVKESAVIPATGHTYDNNWKFDEANHWQVCTVCGEKSEAAAHNFQWVTDKEATETEKGSKHEECAICHFKKAAVEIPATGKPGDPEKPSEPGTDVPQTGDNSKLWLWIALMAISAAGVGVTLLTSKKRGKHAKAQ